MTTTTEPVLLKQYKLLGAVIDAPWATRLDHKIARHVIERYYGRFGNARASLRYLEIATGAERNKIIPSLARIIDNGVLTIVRKGVGTRPTEFDLNFDFDPKIPRGSHEGTSTRGSHEGTSSGSHEGTSSGSRGAREGTQTCLQGMLTSMPTEGRNDPPAVPSAQPVPGPAADTGAEGLEGFEELWLAFPRKHHRAKARAAYNALAPSPELHARLVASAIAWADHYRTTGTETKWQKHLHVWLAEERYLEDLPQPYESPAATKQREPKGQAKAGKHGLSAKTPLGQHDLVITDCKILDTPAINETRLTFDYQIKGGKHDGKQFSHSFLLLCDDEDARMEGQTTFDDIRRAAGSGQVSDASDMLNLSLTANVSGKGQIRYGASG